MRLCRTGARKKTFMQNNIITAALLIVAALRNRTGHCIFVPWFLLSSFFLLSLFLAYSQPSHIACVTYFHTWCEFTMQADLKCATRGSPKIQDAKNRQKFAIWAPLHNFVGLYLRNNQKKNLLNSNISSTCPHNIANFGQLTAEIGS